MRERMGTFYVQCEVSAHSPQERQVRTAKVLVDTDSELSWIAGGILRALGIEPVKKDVFASADGRTLDRDIGFAVLRVGDRFTIDEVVFARDDDLQLLGARTLEGLNLAVDPARKTLVAAGPHPAAALA